MANDMYVRGEETASAVRYELAFQTVPAGGVLALPVCEIRGAGEIRPAEQSGLLLEAGTYLALFSGETAGAGAVLTLNGARLPCLEESPDSGARHLTLQGLVSLRASGILQVRSNTKQPSTFSRAVLTVVKI